jgi:hypothetical protein
MFGRFFCLVSLSIYTVNIIEKYNKEKEREREREGG